MSYAIVMEAGQVSTMLAGGPQAGDVYYDQGQGAYDGGDDGSGDTGSAAPHAFYVPINAFPMSGGEYVALAQVYGPGSDVPELAFGATAPQDATVYRPSGPAGGSPQHAASGAPRHGGQTASANGAVGADGSNPDEVALRLLLPNNMVGSIIGKGGVTIKEITQQSNARIHINHNDDAGTVERLVAVLGTYDEVVNAHRMIAVRVQEEAYTDLAETLVRDGVIASIADLANRMSLIPLKMLIPNVAVGRLIGRGGFNVKRLMAESDAYIVCSREETASRHAQPTERVLTVMGSPHSQTKALRSILQLVGATLEGPGGSSSSDGPAYLDLAGEAAPQQGGQFPRVAYMQPPTAQMQGMYLAGGRPGAPVPVPMPRGGQQQYATLAPPGAPGPYGATAPPMVRPGPMPHGFGGPPVQMQPPGGHFQGMAPPQMWSQSPPLASIPALLPANLAASSVYPSAHWSQAWDTVAVYIPASLVGAIIGRNGSIIKDLSSQTRCAIWIVKEDEPNATEKAVLISGRIDAQFRAQFMIHAKVVEASAGHPSALEPFRVDMLIPNDMIGRIIGKKGAQVRQISDLSGARLIINRDARFPLNSALVPLARSASADTTDSGSSANGGFLGESSAEDLPLRMRGIKDGEAAFPASAGDSTVVTIVGRLEATLMAQQIIRELVHYHRAPERASQSV